MPTYRVTAPDGRTVRLTGDSAPTEAELEEIFAGLPPPPQDAPQAQPAGAGREDDAGILERGRRTVGMLSEGDVGGAARYMAQGAGQSLVGAGKGLVNTLGGLANMAVPGAPFERIPAENRAQEIGMGAEQALEFLTPGGPVKGLAGAAVQGVKAGTIAAAQGADPRLPAALGAAGPLTASLAGKLVPALREGAQRQMARVLGPTTRENKAITEKAVPELLKRGFKGATRTSLLNKATAKLAKAGFDLDKALAKVPKGMPVDTAAVIKHLEDGKQAFIVDGVEIAPEAVERLNLLQETITNLTKQHGGQMVPFESLRKTRQIFDRIVADARGFHGKTVAEGSLLDARRELAGAIRKELAKASPDVAKVNKEYSFWSNVEKVLGDTLERTQSQSKPLGEQLIRGAAVAGGLGGTAVGSGGTAVPAAAAIAGLNKLIRTPGWNTVAAVQKWKLAELIASGRFDEAAALTSRLAAGATAQAR